MTYVNVIFHWFTDTGISTLLPEFFFFMWTLPSLDLDMSIVANLGPVVQSTVSLMSSLVVKMLTVLVSTIFNS